ncbi:MAG: hypothetical protein MJ072_01420, partial [Clostridia bacterium]|nr:hypothetical protein [Clostridia bacterium]
MEDFNSYSEKKTATHDKKDMNKNSGGTGGQNLASLITSLASKYNGKSENELLSAIMAEAERSRRVGTLSNEDIDRFAA